MGEVREATLDLSQVHVTARTTGVAQTFTKDKKPCQVLLDYAWDLDDGTTIESKRMTLEPGSYHDHSGWLPFYPYTLDALGLPMTGPEYAGEGADSLWATATDSRYSELLALVPLPDVAPLIQPQEEPAP